METSGPSFFFPKIDPEARTNYRTFAPKFPGLHLRSIQLTNFKNYETATVEFSGGLNALVGLNGMGKTNLLDAVYYLCMCKSHFGLNDRAVLRRGGEFIRLVGRFERTEEAETIVAKVVPGKRKEFERNGNPYERLADHIGFLPIVFITPDDTQLAREGSEERRRFLDTTLSQTDPEYLRRLMAYNRVLKQRNATLRAFAERGGYNASLLGVYDEQLLEPAAYINARRAEFTHRFVPVFAEYYARISGGQEPVGLTYVSKLNDRPLAELLTAAQESDRRLARTTAGIHRDDLTFRLNNFPVKRFASQGQLKSFVLAFKLAQYAYLREYHRISPILLLDDIFDKLDTHRVRQLLQLLTEQNFGQVFLTDTDPERVGRIAAGLNVPTKILTVESGAVAPTSDDRSRPTAEEE